MAKIMQSVYLCYIFPLEHKKITISRGLTWFLILGKIQDGDYCWWRHRPPAAPLPIKYISSCREDQRLSTKGGKKHIKNPSGGGGGEGLSTPSCTTVGVWICIYVKGLNHPWKICTSFETTYWLQKQKNVSKTAMSAIPEYEFSPATVKLPSLHDRRYRLEVYANRFCHLRPPAWLRKFVMFYCAAR